MYDCQIERAMNSKNLGSRIIKTELWIKKYGSGTFQGQNGLFKRFWANSEIFEVVGGFWRKRQGLLRNLGNFWGFLWIF
jgi:hypothetical protein